MLAAGGSSLFRSFRLEEAVENHTKTDSAEEHGRERV